MVCTINNLDRSWSISESSNSTIMEIVNAFSSFYYLFF